MASAGGSDFVHLHVHTEYSMLDGAARLGDLFAEVERLGQTAIATTDHGYLFGAFDFWSKATAAGIKPIIGVEAYVTPGTSRFDQTRVRFGEQGQEQDDVSARGAYTHMTLLARNNEGLHNLFRASSLASLEGQMGKWPRMDRDLLQRVRQRASSRPPAARRARSRPGCGWASGTRPSARPASCRTSSARTTSTSS